MSLKDLASDLSAYKGQTTPDSIDNQIEKGVDFFDNIQGGADGFTPKTDLESLYHKVLEGTIVAPNAGVRPNKKTRSAYGTHGEYDEVGNPGLSNPSHIFDSDTILSPVDPPQFTSAFMVTPISDWVSNYNPPLNDSLTFGVEQHISTGPTQFTITPFDDTPIYPNAHGLSLLPLKNHFDFTVFRERSREAEMPPFHSSVSAPFTNEPLPSPFLTNKYEVIFGSTVAGQNLRDRYKDGSIHIFNGDSKLPIGGDVVEFASLLPLTGRTSQFSVPEVIGGDNIYTTPSGFATYAGQTTHNLPIENFRTTEGGPTMDTFQSEFSVSTMKKLYEDSSDIEDLFEFSLGDFSNVPAGLQDGKLKTKSFKELADPNNFDLFRQPFILREIGNQWGIDQFETDNPLGSIAGAGVNALDNLAGSIFRGAPGFTGLVSRNITDKFRIGKFLLTSEGIGFLGKQFLLQGLNPTIESKIYNPLSVFGIVGGSDIYNTIKGAVSGGGTGTSELAGGLGSTIVSAFLPIGHSDRHLGGLKYEDLNPIAQITADNPDGIGAKIKSIPLIGNILFDKINDEISNVGGFSRLGAQANMKFSLPGDTTVQLELKDRLLLMNPNRYLFPISSAPKSIHRGVPSFTSGKDLAEKDAQKVESTKGGTFNKKTNTGPWENTTGNRQHWKTSPYSKLTKVGEGDERLDYEFKGKMPVQNVMREVLNDVKNRKGKQVSDDVGKPGQYWQALSSPELDGVHPVAKALDLPIKKNSTKGDSANVVTDYADKINLLPYGTKDEVIGGSQRKDFIKFKFHDMVNNKWIIFRAILEGISDSITPEYGEEKYIGRPDKVYIYQGADRNVSFGFKIYPKTAQELPVLMEKLNYLVGLCYPSYTAEERMVTPLMSLTIGDMFNGAMGLLGSLSVAVEDATTWELNDGLQFPHFITATCEFKYIGNNVLASKGKHYGLNWLPDGSKSITDGTNRFTNENDLGFPDYPNRKDGGSKDMSPLFKELNQPAGG